MKNTTFLYEVIFQKAVWRRASGPPYNLHVCIHAYLPHRIVIRFFSHHARTWKAPRPSSGGLHKTEVPSLCLWSQLLWLMLYSPKAALIGSLDYRPTDTRLHFLQHTGSSCSKPQHPPHLSISTWEDSTTWRPTKPLRAYCRLTLAETHLRLERKFFSEKAQVALGGYSSQTQTQPHTNYQNTQEAKWHFYLFFDKSECT